MSRWRPETASRLGLSSSVIPSAVGSSLRSRTSKIARPSKEEASRREALQKFQAIHGLDVRSTEKLNGYPSFAAAALLDEKANRNAFADFASLGSSRKRAKHKTAYVDDIRPVVRLDQSGSAAEEREAHCAIYQSPSCLPFGNVRNGCGWKSINPS